MSSKSDKVKRWRKNAKERIVNAFGGKCCHCEYDKCRDAMELHHIDPKMKLFGLGSIRANPKNWLSIVEELRKCVLFCANCHREFHAGLFEIPENALRFNEEYVLYKEIGKKEDFDLCPICGILKRKSIITCSRKCSSKRTGGIDWDKFDILELFFKQKLSKIAIADIVGCSDAAVSKRLKKLILGLAKTIETIPVI